MGLRSLAEPRQLVAVENVPAWSWFRSLALQVVLEFVGNLVSLFAELRFFIYDGKCGHNVFAFVLCCIGISSTKSNWSKHWENICHESS